MSSSAETRYVEMTRRLTRVTGGGAFAISTLVTLSCWGDLRLVAILAGFQFLQIPFNVWVNLRLLQRVGAERGELIRNAVNVLAALVTGHLAHFQPVVYLWLPYIALAFEQNSSRYATWALVSICVTFDGLGLLEGVPWMRPLAATVFAIFCARIAKLRVQEMTRMLVEGDVQRRELERAHDAMKEAHEGLTRETKARELAELELRQAQKLEAVGRLAAGLAHEINTPVQFVGDNLRFTMDAVNDLKSVLHAYRELAAPALDPTALDGARAAVRRAEEAADVEYLLAELPAAIDKSLEGVTRIGDIVRSMKEFAQPDQREMVAIDLNVAATSVLTIARHQYAGVASVELNTGALPPVVCHAGEINQVILNLVVNAAQAISEAKDRRPGHIVVGTALESDGRHVHLSIADDGPGIPAAIRGRIFEPFFTTKAVGKGVGQGLAVSRAVIHRHGGTITFESTEGHGTTFHVRLPVEAASSAGGHV